MMVPWRRSGDAIALRVRLTPKVGRDAIEGLVDGADGPALEARVRPAPEDGAGNAALEALLADWLGLARRDVAVSAGHKSRHKVIAIAGDATMIEARLAAALAKLDTRGQGPRS